MAKITTHSAPLSFVPQTLVQSPALGLVQITIAAPPMTELNPTFDAPLRTPPMVKPLVVPKDEPADLRAAIAGFKKLFAEQGHARPVAVAAGFLATHLPALETARVSAHDLVMGQRTSTKELNLIRDAFTRMEGKTLTKEIDQMSPGQQHSFGKICLALRRPYLEQVTRVALQAQVRAYRVSSRLTDPLQEAIEALPPLTLPAPSFADVEAFIGMDIESLTQVVMMECAKESEDDLRTLFTQMKKTNAQRKQIREFVAMQKQNKARAQEDLQREYDRRASLPKGDKARINPELTSFDLYTRSQMLVQHGSVLFDAEGMPLPQDLGYEVSPNMTYYRDKESEVFGRNGSPIPQTTVDLANSLGLTAQKAADLRQYWDEHLAELKAVEGQAGRFPCMEAWLLAPKSAGGVGLSYPAPTGVFQDTVAENYLTQRDPASLVSLLTQSYGVTAAGAKSLVDVWNAQSAPFRAAYDGKMTAWLSEPPPFGPGFEQTQTPRSDDQVNAAITAFKNEQSFGDLGTKYGLDRAELTAIAAYQAKDGRGDVLEGFLTSVMGCKETEDNSDLVRTKMGELAQAKYHPEANEERAKFEAAGGDWAKWKAEKELQDRWDAALKADLNLAQKIAQGNGRTPADFGAIEADIEGLLKVMVQESTMYPKRHDELAARIEQYGDGIMDKDGAAARANIDDKLQALMRASVAVAQLKEYGFANSSDPVMRDKYRFCRGEQERAQNELRDLVDALPAPSKQVAQNYVHAQLDLAGRDEQSMIMRRIDSYWQNGFENKFITGMFFNPGPPNVANWFDRPTGPGTSEKVFVYLKTHQTISNELQSYRDQWTVEEPKFQTFEGLSVPPTLRAEPQMELTQALKDQLKPKTDAAQSALSAMDRGTASYALAAGAHPQKQTGSTLTALPVDDAFVAQVHELATPLDHKLKQPERIETEGSEMSLGRLEADIESWQARYDTLGDSSEAQGIKLQMYQQRRTKFFEMLSNLMKKSAETSSNIIGNIK